MQYAMETVQRQMHKFDGSFLQFRCDEKGFLAICAFGLPGKTHEDGPHRGIMAALSITDALKVSYQSILELTHRPLGILPFDNQKSTLNFKHTDY